MDKSFVTSIIAVNFLQMIWLITYKKLLTLRESLILSGFVFIQFIVAIFISNSYIAFSQLLFLAIKFMFVARKLNNWFIPSLLISIENSLILLSWIPTLDTWDILHINQEISDQTYAKYLYLFIILQQLLLFFLIILVRYLNRRFALSNSISLLPKKYKLLSIVMLLLLFLPTSLKQFSVLNGDPVSVLYSSGIVIGCTVIVTLNVLLATKYNNEKQYIELLSKTYRQEKEKVTLSNEFRQDYQNLLLSLNSYLEQKEKKKAVALLNNIIDYSDPLLTPNLYKKISSISNPPIRGLLTSFLTKCLTATIDIDLQVTDNLTDLTMNIVDFIRCFSILLNNAYEATEQTEYPFIGVFIEGTQEFLTIEVRNTYNEEKKVSFQTLLQNNFSTKAGHQGKGLYIFMTILDQYPECDYTITQKENQFIANFTLLKNTDERRYL